MATDFQTKTIKDAPTDITNANAVLTGVYTSGEATVHAIYISNKHSDSRTISLGLYDGAGTGDANRKAYILYNTEVPPASTLVLEKPINLNTSTTTSEQRQLRISASAGSSIDVMASVLVIT